MINSNLKISTAPTKAKSREPANLGLQTINQNIDMGQEPESGRRRVLNGIICRRRWAYSRLRKKIAVV